MNPLPVLWWGAALLFCLWTSLLARLKGYSALCWLLAGGPVGVLVLCLLPLVSPVERKPRHRANRWGLILSTLSLVTAWWCRAWL